jgi:hypothetical protein
MQALWRWVPVREGPSKDVPLVERSSANQQVRCEVVLVVPAAVHVPAPQLRAMDAQEKEKAIEWRLAKLLHMREIVVSYGKSLETGRYHLPDGRTAIMSDNLYEKCTDVMRKALRAEAVLRLELAALGVPDVPPPSDAFVRLSEPKEIEIEE